MTEQQKHLRQIALELAALLNHDMTPERTQEAREKVGELQGGLTGNEPPRDGAFCIARAQLIPGEMRARYMAGNAEIYAVTLKA
jgi:hypothetical protein